MGEIDENAEKGRSRTQSGGNFLQGGDTGGTPIWLGDLGTIGGNGKDGRGDALWVSEKNHG